MIFVILIFASILRLINLNQCLWLDEAVQAITAQKSFGYIFQEISGDFHPPLYHFLMHFWVRIFGSSEVILRLPSVLFGVGTVFIVYKIAMHMHLKNVAILVAVFLATAPFHIYYSQEARMYSLAAFLTAGSFYFFLRILEDDKRWLRDRRGVGYFLGYFLFTLLALYTDYYAFLVLLVQCIFLLTRKRYKFLLLNTFFLILFYLPWVPMFMTQVKTGMLATRSLPGWGDLVNVSFIKALPLTFIKFSIGRITIFNKSLYAGIVLVIGLVYGFLILKACNGWLKEKLKDDKKLIIIGWFFVPMIVAWLVSLLIPNFQPFRLLLILPAFYLLLARGIEGLGGKKWKKGIVIGIVLFVNLVSLSIYYFNPYFYREDWRGTVAYLSKRPDAVVLLPSETSNWPIKYYDPEGKLKLVGGVVEVGEVVQFGEIENVKENQIYYIRYLVPLFDPGERILVKLEEQGYTKVKEISFNQIPVWEYKKQ